MDITALLSLISNQDALFRLVLLVLISLYVLFALIVAIQIANLNKELTQINFSKIFTFLGFFHSFLAIALLIVTVLSL